ncbi:MAG: trigger factor [Candidatus Paceibacterota bacterium]|jgi:FKBP-type peptidyl-prolyl cis-trans isomerase (trigger factor)
MIKIYKIKDTKNLPDCEVEITAEIEESALETYKIKAFKKIKEVAELPGFRKGHVPDGILKEKFGELGLLEDAAELAINDCAIEIIAESKVNFLGRPNISITKLAIGSPIEFKIQVTTMPEVKIADYKKIAKKENSKEEKVEEVTEKQIDETIEQIRKMYAEQNHSHAPGEEHKEGEELPLPEVNDEFVKKLGEFKDVADFRAKLKENIAKEKEFKAKDKKRLEILEEIIKDSTIEMPKAIVESELDKMEGQFKADIAQMGLQPEDYLKHIKKTWEELRNEWKPDAEKRAKTQIVLQKISLEEKLDLDEEGMKKEIAHLTEQHKGADPERVKAYVEMIFSNEAVIKFLESQK